MVYTSCFTSCQTNQELGPQEIRKYQENLKALYNYSLVLSLPLKIKVSSIQTKNSLKTEIQLFLQFAISLENYCLYHIFCPWLQFQTFFKNIASQIYVHRKKIIGEIVLNIRIWIMSLNLDVLQQRPYQKHNYLLKKAVRTTSQ